MRSSARRHTTEGKTPNPNAAEIAARRRNCVIRFIGLDDFDHLFVPAERSPSLYLDGFARDLESAAAVGRAGDVDYRIDLVLVPIDRHPAQSRIDVVSIDRLAGDRFGVVDLPENLVRLVEIPSYHHHLRSLN